jgi:hypothetical protein
LLTEGDATNNLSPLGGPAGRSTELSPEKEFLDNPEEDDSFLDDYD